LGTRASRELISIFLLYRSDGCNRQTASGSRSSNGSSVRLDQLSPQYKLFTICKPAQADACAIAEYDIKLKSDDNSVLLTNS